MRYRPPSSWPGAKRPSEGADEVRMREAVEGARGVEGARVRVANASLEVGAPHEGQNRLGAISSLAHAAQTMHVV